MLFDSLTLGFCKGRRGGERESGGKSQRRRCGACYRFVASSLRTLAMLAIALTRERFLCSSSAAVAEHTVEVQMAKAIKAEMDKKYR